MSEETSAEGAPRVFADIQTGHGTHHYHARLLIEPRFGGLLRMGFTPPLMAGEEPAMPLNPAALRELAAGAIRMADFIEAAQEAHRGRG